MPKALSWTLVLCISAPFLAREAPAQEGRFEPTAEESRAMEVVSEPAIRAHTQFLADDLLEGRGPGSRGDGLAQAYILSQLRALGFRPAAPGGNWFQPVPLLGVTTKVPGSLAFRRGPEAVELRFLEDYIAVSGLGKDPASVQDAEVVFVGYGIRAREHDWDDFKGEDLRGRCSSS